MYVCNITGTDKINQYEELIKVFLRSGEYEISGSLGDGPGTYSFDGDKDELKRSIYRDLRQYTGKSPKWGILTGIRPVKMAFELYKKHGSLDKVKNILEEEYFLHSSKSSLVTEILEYQLKSVGRPENGSLSVYAGIPFCPTRCLYCSFTSNQKPYDEIERYLEALKSEIVYASEAAAADGFRTESFYIGGGTPTTLDERQLESLLETINDSFDLSSIREFTVEAGRPDTITRQKLDIMKAYGVDRISINPQTMNDDTLELIGRKHTADDVRKAFGMAHEAGIKVINADLIAGLPGEDAEDFRRSLEEILQLGADNITLHTLAVKRASKLKEADEEYNYRNEELREEMLAGAADILSSEGFRPYYLYRQKHTSGNTENTGYCRGDTPSVYNIRIMEEAQSILALGAGGISKIYFPEENRLERVANVSNYEIYIERLEEMKERKRKGFFGQTGKDYRR